MNAPMGNNAEWIATVKQRLAQARAVGNIAAIADAIYELQRAGAAYVAAPQPTLAASSAASAGTARAYAKAAAPLPQTMNVLPMDPPLAPRYTEAKKLKANGATGADEVPAIDTRRAIMLGIPQQPGRSVFKRGGRQISPRPSAIVEKTATGAELIDLTEDAVACAFVRRHQGELLFDFGRGKWRAWDESRWRVDGTQVAFEYARRVTATLNQDNRARWAKASVYAAVERIAQSDRTFACRGDEFDRDKMLLNTPAGTIDLRVGTMREHRPDDLITMVTGVAPEAGPHPVFDRFMADITCGDQALADYLQRALGSCLSGALTDHFLLFLHGDGRNGKNTLGDLVLFILGDYARKIAAQTLMTDARGSRHPTEIANLRGLRLAVSSEVGEGEYWDEAKVKELTGDEMLAGRYMRCDFFEFPAPTSIWSSATIDLCCESWTARWRSGCT